MCKEIKEEIKRSISLEDLRKTLENNKAMLKGLPVPYPEHLERFMDLDNLSKELGKDSKMQPSDETIDKTTHIVYKVMKTVVEKVLGHSINLITQLGIGYLYFVKFPNVSPFIKIPAIIIFNEVSAPYMRKGTNKLKENRIEMEEKDV